VKERKGAQREGAQRKGARREGSQRKGAQRKGARREGAGREGQRGHWCNLPSGPMMTAMWLPGPPEMVKFTTGN
jgi:hypothetical protein